MFRYRPVALAILGAALFRPGMADATTILVPNFDFTQPGQSGGSYSVDDITDWAGVGTQYGVQDSLVGEYPGGVPVGNNFAYANNAYIYLNSSTDAAFAQTIQAGTYVLSVEIGNRLDYAFSGSAYIGIWANLAPADDYVFQSAPAPGSWVNVTLTDIVSASDPNIGQPLTILLGDQGYAGGSQQVDFNDVTLTFTPPGGDPVAVPEPLTFSLFGAGLAGVATLRRRRKA